MDFIRELIGAPVNMSIKVPDVQDWFTNMPTAFLVLVSMAVLFSVTSVLLGVVHLIYVWKYISNEQIQTDLYWIIFMCPVVSLCGSVGMILPRSAVFLYAVALVYFMLCLFVMVTLMTTLHGSRQVMCEKLLERRFKISVRVLPLGCCLFCVPKLDPTDKNIRRIEWLVFQSPIVRILLEITNIVVLMELDNRSHMFFQVSNLIGMCSLFVGSYGSYMIIPAGSKLLKAYRFQLMFRMVDLSQLAYSVQKFFFDFLGAVGAFGGTYLPAVAQGQFYASFLLTVEMLFLSIMATIVFRPSQTIFFDKYKHVMDDEECAAAAAAERRGSCAAVPHLDGLADFDEVRLDSNNNTRRFDTQSTCSSSNSEEQRRFDQLRQHLRHAGVQLAGRDNHAYEPKSAPVYRGYF